jgi:hypothetical protein
MPGLRFFSEEKFEARLSHREYEQYWLENRHRMPESLLRINGGMLPERCFPNPEGAIDLHDARIRTFHDENGCISMHLHGNLAVRRGRKTDWILREIWLSYSGAAASLPPSGEILTDKPDSDIMVHETTILNDGRFNHKILFASGEILSLDFSALDVKIKDHPDDDETVT